MAKLISLILVIEVFGAFAAKAVFAEVEAVWGAGRASCAVWNDALQHDHHVAAALAEWVSGYVSANNQTSKRRKHLTDMQVDGIVNGWLRNYCEQHRANLISDAAQALVDYQKAQ